MWFFFIFIYKGLNYIKKIFFRAKPLYLFIPFYTFSLFSIIYIYTSFLFIGTIIIIVKIFYKIW
jgi:hypothetical protein